MQKLKVKGKNILSGEIKISGSKNATLPILAASILSEKKIDLKRVPLVKDVVTMCHLLKYMGSNIKINSQNKNILIDTGPDLRQQALENKINKIDYVLYTHAHRDHVSGIDELRSFNFIQKKGIKAYGVT